MKKLLTLAIKPFKWLWTNLKDIKTLIIFIIVFLLLSSEVWVFYLLGVITWGSTFSKRCLGVASACWIFWLGPFTPFMPLCIGITFGVKAIFNKIKHKHLKLPTTYKNYKEVVYNYLNLS